LFSFHIFSHLRTEINRLAGSRVTESWLRMGIARCPIEGVKPIDYKKAMILFYEQNNLYLYKTLFVEQFAFAVNNYFR
jgi:hypothetical protein